MDHGVYSFQVFNLVVLGGHTTKL